ncbi:MAG: antibiotic biosynthesis monooxygenase [Ignavibacteriales bacterium]|nr:antibiotic biosynthesis monooxygenase [Ignavibacteriales bacterium]
MFLRMVSVGIRAEHALKIAEEYDRNVVTALRTQPGCSFASLLQNINDTTDCISLTIWNTKSDADEYEKSGVFKRLVESLRTFYEESNEWELKLTDDLSIDYTPVQIDPTVKGYDDADTEKKYIRKFNITPYAATVITLSVQPDKTQDFQDIFVTKVIPKFTEHKGFIHIILLRKSNEFNIISFWDETIDFNASFNDQVLRSLTRSIFEMLPSSVQWQVSHKSSKASFASSEEITASVYRCLTGEWFSK